MTDTPSLTAEALRQFTGTYHYYRHALMRDVLCTDGVVYLAETGAAHWLVDQIALAQLHSNVRREAFQLWILRVDAQRSATLTCDDGNGRVVHTISIPCTDFPLDEVELYCCDNVLMLPSEY
jgi:hypothetical protein